MFRFHTQVSMTAGNGLFRQLPSFLREKGYARPTVLVDEGFARSDLWRDVAANLQREFGGVLNVRLNPGVAEPTYDGLRETLRGFQSLEQDVVVGIGGGSCMDTAKAVSALLTNPGDPLDYRGFDKLTRPGIPVVLIPTTAGTGSESSFNASFVDTVGNRKMGINGRHMFAAHALLDGETTLSCPYRAALGAGIDALVHTLEGYVCKQRTPLSDMLARRAFAYLVPALPALKQDPHNLDRRLDLLLGAFLGGIIQMNSGSGVAAAISYPLSVYYKVPHGIGGGMFAVDMIKFNIEAGFDSYADLAPLIAIPSRAGSRVENAWSVHAHLQELWTILEVPNKLSTFGIGPERRDHVLEIMKTQQPGFDQNPVPFTVADHLPAFMEQYFQNTYVARN